MLFSFADDGSDVTRVSYDPHHRRAPQPGTLLLSRFVAVGRPPFVIVAIVIVVINRKILRNTGVTEVLYPGEGEGNPTDFGHSLQAETPRRQGSALGRNVNGTVALPGIACPLMEPGAGDVLGHQRVRVCYFDVGVTVRAVRGAGRMGRWR